MPKKIQLVTGEKDGTFTFTCPYPTGCGVDTDDGHVPWTSSNWKNRGLATSRGQQHLREHETAADPDVPTEVTPPLEEFYVDNGLVDPPAPPVDPTTWEV